MSKIIKNEKDIVKIRSRFQSEGKFIVMYEDVERNVNEFIFGEAKLTPTILSDINNLVEGVVFDDCIELGLTRRQKKENTPLTESILKLSNYIADVEDIIKEVDKYVLSTTFHHYINFQNSLDNLIETGCIDKVALENHSKRTEKILESLPNSSEIHQKYIDLKFYLKEGRWKEYLKCSYDLNLGLPEEILRELTENNKRFFIEVKLLTGSYDLNVSSDKIEQGLQKLASGELFDPLYELAKAGSLVYQNYYGKLNMSVRLPAQLRFPLMHGLSIPRLTYNIYKEIADLHKVSVDLLIKFGGVIQIYIPPLLSILLSRCNKKDDFPERLIELREEFQNLRTSVHKYLKDIKKPKSLKEQLKVVQGIVQAFDLLKKEMTEVHTSIIYQSWEIVREGAPFKIFAGIMDLLVEKEKKDSILRQIHPFVDLWTMSLEIRDYGRLLEKVFGEEKINYESFRKSEQLIKTYESFLFPLGRKR